MLAKDSKQYKIRVYIQFIINIYCHMIEKILFYCKAKVARLEHRCKNHMLVFIYNYIHDETMVDNRNIHTQRHDGVLFKIPPIEHYKVKQDPMLMAVTA